MGRKAVGLVCYIARKRNPVHLTLERGPTAFCVTALCITWCYNKIIGIGLILQKVAHTMQEWYWVHTFDMPQGMCLRLCILSKCKRVKDTTLYFSSFPWYGSSKKSGGYFTLLEGFHSRTEWKITQKDANFNLKEWKTTRKRVVFNYGSSKSAFSHFYIKEYVPLVAILLPQTEYRLNIGCFFAQNRSLDLEDFPRYTVTEDKQTFRIANVQPEDEELTYHCDVSNEAGAITASAQLEVVGKFRILIMSQLCFSKTRCWQSFEIVNSTVTLNNFAFLKNIPFMSAIKGIH